MKRYLIIFAASFLVFILIFGGGYLVLNNVEQSLQDKDFENSLNEQPDLTPPEAEEDIVVNTLLLGVDEARSDTIIVARYNKQTHQVVMISVPRDTRVEIPGYGFEKINAAVGKKGGTALAMKTVGNLLDIPIHHYVKVDFKGVEKIVDILGGVKINVPQQMDYDDPAQDLHIHIKAGLQLLKGEQALHFLRYRSGYTDQDLGRIKAQQEFAKAFMNKLTSPAIILKAPSLITTMIENTKTNLEQKEIGQYILDIGNIKVDNIKMYTLPGEPGYKNKVAYFIHDEEKLDEMMATMNQELGIAKKESSQDTTTISNKEENTGIVKNEIKIEILNSTNTKGLAAAMKEKLEQKGYVVEKIGDTKDLTYSYSRVIDRKGDKNKLEQLSSETGIGMTDSDINLSYNYDITIIIGNDKKQ
ncbi:MAG: LCP family protein [Lutisporaceae bacterium]